METQTFQRRSQRQAADSKLALDNLINVDISAVSRNFRIVSEQLSQLAPMATDIEMLVKWKGSVEARLDNFKNNCEKNNLEVRNMLRNQSKRRESVLPEHIMMLSRQQPAEHILQNFLPHDSRESSRFRGPLGSPNRRKSIEETDSDDEQLEQIKNQMKSMEEDVNEKIEEVVRQLSDVKAELSQTDWLYRVKEDLEAYIKRMEAMEGRCQKNTSSVEELERKLAEELHKSIGEVQQLRETVTKKLETFSANIKKKVDQSDLVKLEELLLGAIDLASDTITKSASPREETKKALIFLEKRLNRIQLEMHGTENVEGDPLVSGKTWCLSCTKEENKHRPKTSGLKMGETEANSAKKTLGSTVTPTLVPSKTSNSYMSQSAKQNSQTGHSRQMVESTLTQQSNIMVHFGTAYNYFPKINMDYMAQSHGGISGHLGFGTRA